MDIECAEFFASHPSASGDRVANDSGVEYNLTRMPSCFWGECNPETNECICWEGAIHDRLILRQNNCGIHSETFIEVVALLGGGALVLSAFYSIYSLVRVKKNTEHRFALLHCLFAAVFWAALSFYYYFIREMDIAACVLFTLGVVNTAFMVGRIVMSVLTPIEFFLPHVNTGTWRFALLTVIPIMYLVLPAIAFGYGEASRDDVHWNYSLATLGLSFVGIFLLLGPKVVSFIDELLRGLDHVAARRPTVLNRQSTNSLKHSSLDNKQQQPHQKHHRLSHSHRQDSNNRISRPFEQPPIETPTHVNGDPVTPDLFSIGKQNRKSIPDGSKEECARECEPEPSPDPTRSPTPTPTPTPVMNPAPASTREPRRSSIEVERRFSSSVEGRQPHHPQTQSPACVTPSSKHKLVALGRVPLASTDEDEAKETNVGGDIVMHHGSDKEARPIVENGNCVSQRDPHHKFRLDEPELKAVAEQAKRRKYCCSPNPSCWCTCAACACICPCLCRQQNQAEDLIVGNGEVGRLSQTSQGNNQSSRTLASDNKGALRLKRKVVVLRRLGLFAAVALSITCSLIALIYFILEQVPFMFVTFVTSGIGFAIGGAIATYYTRAATVSRRTSEYSSRRGSKS